MKKLFLGLSIICMSFFFVACGSSKSGSSKSALAGRWVEKDTNSEYASVIEIFKDGSYKYYPNGFGGSEPCYFGECVEKEAMVIFTATISGRSNTAEYQNGELIFNIRAEIEDVIDEDVFMKE